MVNISCGRSYMSYITDVILTVAFILARNWPWTIWNWPLLTHECALGSSGTYIYIYIYIYMHVCFVHWL